MFMLRKTILESRIPKGSLRCAGKNIDVFKRMLSIW